MLNMASCFENVRQNITSILLLAASKETYRVCFKITGNKYFLMGK